jgi:hypothetical protein
MSIYLVDPDRCVETLSCWIPEYRSVFRIPCQRNSNRALSTRVKPEITSDMGSQRRFGSSKSRMLQFLGRTLWRRPHSLGLSSDLPWQQSGGSNPGFLAEERFRFAPERIEFDLPRPFWHEKVELLCKAICLCE